MDVRIKLNETKDENEDLKIDELVEELRKIVKIREKNGVQLKENFGEIKRFKERGIITVTPVEKVWRLGQHWLRMMLRKRTYVPFVLVNTCHQAAQNFQKPKKGERYFRSTANVLVACRRGIGLRNAGEQNCAANARKGSIMNHYVMENMRKREHLKCVVL